MFRVKRISNNRDSSPPPTPPPEQVVATKTVVVRDTTNRGTTPPPSSFYNTYSTNQSEYYPASYQSRNQQAVSTVRYRTPPPAIHRNTTITPEVVVRRDPLTNATTTTKTSTRVLDASTLPGLNDDIIEETVTTTTTVKPMDMPIVPAVVASSLTTAPQVIAAAAPAIIDERPIYRRRRRRIRTRTASTISEYTTSSTSSYSTSPSITPRHHVIKQHTILPPRPPIETTIINEPTTIVPERRFIHHVRRTRINSGYYSSDLDYGKKKVYKTDYKYRHYYYCNYCKGRCDLPNSSCSCCEWFYGCPLWILALLGLLLLGLVVTFFTLFGLQPTLNPARRSATAQKQILNRTAIIYGFLQNCGTQTNTPTTLALCVNTQTTSTVRIDASSTYVASKSFKISIYNELLICICSYFFINLI